METTTKLMLERAVAGACAVLLAGAAQAALHDAFYDADLNITWLQDADVNGLMDWDTAVAWADGYRFGGYADWRLPSTIYAMAVRDGDVPSIPEPETYALLLAGLAGLAPARRRRQR